MKLLKIVVLVGSLYLQAYGETMEEARSIYNGYTAQEIAESMSEELAKIAPMRVDAISYIISSIHMDSTVVVNTIIEQDALRDMAYVDVKKMTKEQKGEYAQKLIENMQKLHLNALCTTTMTRVALEKGVNYDYIYSWDDFTYLGEVKINNEACVNSKL